MEEDVNGMNDTIRTRLVDLIDGEYRKFSSALIPNVDNILGVRLPELRKIAGEIASGDWQSYLSNTDSQYFEELMIEGMIIGYIDIEPEERLSYIEGFVPKIDNWSICDSFCSGLKFTEDNRELVWNFLQPYFDSEEEYYIRFGVVMLLNYFIESDYIEDVLEILDTIEHEGYYAKMSVAWTISKSFIDFPQKTLKFLRDNNLDDFTYNKTLQKIVDSRRVDPKTKDIIRSMKRKNVQQNTTKSLYRTI